MRNGVWLRRGLAALITVLTLCPLALNAQRRTAGALSVPALEREPAVASHGSMRSTGWVAVADAESTAVGKLLSPNWRGAGPERPLRDEESRRRKHAKIGALIGGGFGAAVGLLGGAADEGLNADQDGNSGLKIVGAGLAGALIFGAIGAGIGALIP